MASPKEFVITKYFVFSTFLNVLTTTSEQWPPVYNGQARKNIDSPFNVQPLNNNHFWTTATFFESQGWPLYTGLNVFLTIAKFTHTFQISQEGLKFLYKAIQIVELATNVLEERWMGNNFEFNIWLASLNLSTSWQSWHN